MATEAPKQTSSSATDGQQKLPIVVLISGNGSNLQAIIDATAAGLNAEVKAVISNKAGAYGLTRAANAGIATEVIEHTDFDSREAFDEVLAQTIDKYQPALIVLAGFMRILTPGFVRHYLGRMLNIHPSLLPKYQGLNTHQRALDAGDELHGVSIHFVTPELDGGPVVAQVSIPVHQNDTAETLAQRIHEQEHKLYPEVIGWVADGRLDFNQGTPLLDNKPITT